MSSERGWEKRKSPIEISPRTLSSRAYVGALAPISHSDEPQRTLRPVPANPELGTHHVTARPASRCFPF